MKLHQETATSILLLAGALMSTTVHAEDALYNEKYRPQFHFTSSRDWINDPNGLVYFEGEYHLYFQRAPGQINGAFEKSWGRAFSKDLVHWEQTEADAILPSVDNSIWSGCALVDWKNTSGFGKDGKPPLIAAYTRADEKNNSDQRVAYSIDKGRTWTVYEKPILPHIHGINRDPKIIWHEPTNQWVMALYLDKRHHFALYTSPNLKEWKHLQDITLDHDDECPDFFPLNLDGDPAKQKWIFTGANGRYVVGSFDGKQFVPETDSLESDRGTGAFYAAQTYSDTPDGRRIQIGWLRGPHYEGMPFNQQLGFPLELTLRSTPRGPRLFKWPVKEIESLYAKEHRSLNGVTGELLDIEFDLPANGPKETTLSVRGFPITFVAEGPAGAIRAWDRRVSVTPVDGKVKLRVLVDRTSIELFVNDGQIVMSGFGPKDGQGGISLTSTEGEAKVGSLVVRELKSAWKSAPETR